MTETPALIHVLRSEFKLDQTEYILCFEDILTGRGYRTTLCAYNNWQQSERT